MTYISEDFSTGSKPVQWTPDFAAMDDDDLGGFVIAGDLDAIEEAKRRAATDLGLH
jgi:hypothetical protein